MKLRSHRSSGAYALQMMVHVGFEYFLATPVTYTSIRLLKISLHRYLLLLIIEPKQKYNSTNKHVTVKFLIFCQNV